jgi:hypothetical protein
MAEWMLGSLIVAALIAKILESLHLLDLSDVTEGIFSLILGTLKLVASLLFAVGAFCVYLTRRSEKKSS